MARFPDDFNWRDSPKHMGFLKHFLRPYHGVTWQQHTIKESVRSATERFIRDGALVECSLEEKVSEKLKVSELKQILLRHGEKVSGNKPDLVAAAMRVATDELTERTKKIFLYKCTPLGEACLAEFDVRRQETETKAQNESHVKLMAGDAKAAVAAFATFQRAFVDARYSSSDWQVDGLRFILKVKPKTIGEFDELSWKQIQAATAMKELWRDRDGINWLPEGFRTPIGDNDRAIRGGPHSLDH